MAFEFEAVAQEDEVAWDDPSDYDEDEEWEENDEDEVTYMDNYGGFKISQEVKVLKAHDGNNWNIGNTGIINQIMFDPCEDMHFAELVYKTDWGKESWWYPITRADPYFTDMNPYAVKLL